MGTPETHLQKRMDDMGLKIAKSLAQDVSVDIQTRLDFARNQAIEKAKKARLQTQHQDETVSTVFNSGSGQLSQTPNYRMVLFFSGLLLAIVASLTLVYMGHDIEDDEWVQYETPAAWVVNPQEHETDASTPE